MINWAHYYNQWSSPFYVKVKASQIIFILKHMIFLKERASPRQIPFDHQATRVVEDDSWHSPLPTRSPRARPCRLKTIYCSPRAPRTCSCPSWCSRCHSQRYANSCRVLAGTRLEVCAGEDATPRHYCPLETPGKHRSSWDWKGNYFKIQVEFQRCMEPMWNVRHYPPATYLQRNSSTSPSSIIKWQNNVFWIQ